MTVPKIGRPYIGPELTVKVQPEILAKIAAHAAAAGVSKSEWVRRALAKAVK